MLNNVSKKYQLFTKWAVSVNPESSPTDPPHVYFKKYSPVWSSIQRDPEYCSEIPQREYGGKKLCANFVEFVLKTQK